MSTKNTNTTASTLIFTGERYVPELEGIIKLEHIHRYLQACEIVFGKVVLDIACGEGYGSAMLSDRADKVIGVDISIDTVKHARKRYKKDNLEFMVGNCADIPLPDASVDVVVSFETIEHHDQHERMMQEIKRVLKSEGVFLISNPDKYYYSVESGTNNPYHLKELYQYEFKQLLEKYFANVAYFGQRVIYGSGIFAESLATVFTHYYQEDGAVSMSQGIVQPLYGIALASNAQLPKITTGILEQPINDSEIIQSWSKLVENKITQITTLSNELAESAKLELQLKEAIAGRDIQIQGLTDEIAEYANLEQQLKATIAGCDSQIHKLTDEIAEYANLEQQLKATIAGRDSQIHKLTNEIAEYAKFEQLLKDAISEHEAKAFALSSELEKHREWILTLEQQLNEENSKITQLPTRKTWNQVMLLRMYSRWLFDQKYVKTIIKRAGKIYVSLPLSYQTRAAHRRIMAKYLPSLLRVSEGLPASIPLMQIPVGLPLADSAIDVSKIKLVTSEQPVASVIIPIYGKCDYTLRCLLSIANNPPVCAFEIIVIDDCSPDNSAEILQKIEGIRLVSNAKNQGFIRSCNLGAKQAKGQYLHFLNNDTEVTQNWLDELIRTFYSFPGTGFVGSKLVYPDGSLQEAGGIIWQDGSAWNFGRYKNPALPIFNYAREVDYCSGASIAIPKELFDELGGFDEHYLPAYCEDSDLALKIRDRGYRVIYQPLSVVIHYEGITSGTDVTQGTKSYQIENSKKLFHQWQNRLAAHQIAGADADNAKDRMAKHRVLVIDHCTPTPNQDAGSVTVFNLLLLLREMGFQVTFIPEDNFLYMPDYTLDLQRNGIEVVYAPYVTSVEQHLKETARQYDLVFLFRPRVVERHLKIIRKLVPNAKILYHTVDLHYLRMMREADLLKDAGKKRKADEMKRRELAILRTVDASIVHSTTELEILSKELPDAKIHVFPLIMDIRGTNKKFDERKDIVFVGGYQHPPNVDAVKYLVTKIMPLLRTRLPGVKFYAVGSQVPPEIGTLACKDIIITGFIEDLNPLLDKMRVSVAPLRYGAGIKGKIGTAMAVGLPTVGTPLAVEGMRLTDGENILVADGYEAFASAVVKLYKESSIWDKLSEAGLVFAKQAWGAEAAWKILNTILADISIPTSRNTYALSLFQTHSPLVVKQQSIQIVPIASVQSCNEFKLVLESDELKKIRAIEKSLIDSSTTEAFSVNGFCVPCNKKVSFLVDMKSGGQRQDNGWIPNWRERLECPLCGMNNRQRLMATLVKQELDVYDKKNVYFMEQITPIYNWANATFKKHSITGSEYLGHEYEGGTLVKGIRHEDVENLSFPDGALDLIVSNDVFEHVPNPARAFAECVRVLKLGGMLLATIPFHFNNDKSTFRAEIINGQLEHILPPLYHGNPVSAEGSLVFTDFGWDVLKTIQAVGFSDVCLEIYASAELGHLGGGQLALRAVK